MRSTVPALALHAAAFGALAGCGFDALLLTPRGFEPTEPERVVLEGRGLPDSEIEVWSRDERQIATTRAGGDGLFAVSLPPNEQGALLRIYSRAGARSLKAIVPTARRGERTPIGNVDSGSTVLAQLVAFEIQAEAGSTFSATPEPAVRGLLTAVTSSPAPALFELESVIRALDDAASEGAEPPFDPLGFELSEAFSSERSLDASIPARYKMLLAAAAAGYGLEIRCDPSRINAMFSVDVSGRGLDGNGAPQLIRQPSKEGVVYFGFTTDESSAVSDAAVPPKLTPNDPRYVMTDDGKGGDERAGDGIFTVVVPLPRGARLQYKYTNGSAGEGFTGTEEWPGNARILLVEDVLTGRPDGQPDCVLVRRDSFGDEASNKNFVNLHRIAKERAGAVGFDTDLGGADLVEGQEGVVLGGISIESARGGPLLTPAGLPEARENGVCGPCPAPLILDPDDDAPPVLLSAERTSVTRVRLRFSEPILAEDARDVTRYQYLDETDQPVPIIAARPTGSEVVLDTQPTHPIRPATIEVRGLRDVAASSNVLQAAQMAVRPDQTPPRVLSVRGLSRLDIDPLAAVEDPTRGELVELIFDELPELSGASDPTRYRIVGLEVFAAVVVDGAPAPTVRLVTAPQEKSKSYLIEVVGVRDPAGNALVQEARFDAFSLYKVTFGVVVGFAFASSDGQTRGLLRQEALYLTGTPLAAARDLAGRSVSVLSRGGIRTDVTGWPQFELSPGPRAHLGQPVYEIELLLPAGSWAWKAAHGIEGEYVRPPTTLEKVYKTLATTNDATGVRIDPATLIADNGVDYGGAALSPTGEEPARRTVMFKREAPDEVCEVSNKDVRCPFVVVGAWRDLELDPGGRTRDYDDSVPTLPPHRPELGDFAAPKLLDASARDSFSLLLSFDESIATPASTLRVELADAETGVGRAVEVLQTDEVLSHQAVVRLSEPALPLEISRPYTVRYRGARDVAVPAHVDRNWRTATVVAPDRVVPFRPLTDVVPPALISIVATDLQELIVELDEPIDPASLAAERFVAEQISTRAPLPITQARLLADRRRVRLTTGTQAILEAHRLTISGLSDVADPPNVISSTTAEFIGFGEREPPGLDKVRAIGPETVLVRFDEPVDVESAMDPSRYRITGLTVRGVEVSGDPARRALAFNSDLAPQVRDVVLLTTSPMIGAQTYPLTVGGVRDLSGNPSQIAASFEGVLTAPTIDVILEVQISDSIAVAGRVPSRAIGLAELSESREGVFVVGARGGPDQRPVPGSEGPVNDALGGFPPEGSPLDGIEPRLRDDGLAPDRVAGDGIFAIRAARVPLGSTVLWKSFSPFTTIYRDQNPTRPEAAFADALPGPSVFSDGQEYPGNENGVVILDEGRAEPGVVRIRCLFGDEVTYKKHTGGASFVWIADDR